jgi:uncharacterized protein
MRVDSPGKLLLGLGSGIAFGGLLQKGRAAKNDVIVDQLLLRDHTIAKIMGTAITVGAAGFHALERRGRVQPDVKSLKLGGIVGGALLFGTGLAVLGYCPGTSLAALGERRGDAVAGVLGMLAGALAFVRTYPRLRPLIEAGDLGKQTLPGLTRTSPWPWVAAMGVALAVSAVFSRPPARRR